MKLHKLEEIAKEIGRGCYAVFLNITKEYFYSIKILRATTQKSSLGKLTLRNVQYFYSVGLLSYGGIMHIPELQRNVYNIKG